MAIIVEVNGDEIEFPDTMSPEEIQAALAGMKSPQAQTPVAPQKPAYQSTWKDPVRAGLQGMTLGAADEIGTAIAALGAGIFDGANVLDTYSDMQGLIDKQQRQYAEANPGTALTLELLGGLTTGGAAGAKVLGSNAVQGLSRPVLKSVVAPALVGGAEGAFYGAASAEQGDRLNQGAQMAAIGAVGAPILGAAANKVGSLLGSAGAAVAKKALESPEDEAARVLRTIAEQANLPADEVAQRYQKLGQDGTLMDTDDTLRFFGRSLSDKGGEAGSTMRRFAEARQMGQNERLTAATKQAISADDSYQTVKEIIERRSQEAAPLYDEARKKSFRMTPYVKAMIEKEPSVKDAFSKALVRSSAKRAAGEKVSHFEIMDQTKKALDDKIGSLMRSGEKEYARDLIKVKNRILKDVDKQIPEYEAARNIYTDETKLLNAIDKGKKFANMDFDEFDDLLATMGDAELDMFRRGAAKSILNKLDKTQFTFDAAKKTFNTKDMHQKLTQLFKSESVARDFIDQIGREAEFTKTRQALNGSMTSRNLNAGEQADNIANTVVDLASGNHFGLAMKAVDAVIGKKGLTPEAANEAARLLSARGLTDDQIRQVFERSRLAQVASSYLQAAPNVTKGAIAPGLVIPMRDDQ